MASKQLVIIGAGGLGVAVAWGILERAELLQDAELLIVDPDVVELSNLNRQIFFNEADVGRAKAEVLCERLQTFCGSEHNRVRCTPLRARVDTDTVEAIVGAAALVLDACDSAATKFLLNDYCVAQRIPFCYAGVIGTTGMGLAVGSNRPCACLRCVFGDVDAQGLEASLQSCRSGGVLGPLAGQMGLLQADLALQLWTGSNEQSQFVRLNPDLSMRSAGCEPDPSCPLGCGRPVQQLLDIRQKRCPTTFLYTKLALEQCAVGSVLDVRIDSEATARSVAHSAQEEGHFLISEPRKLADQHWRLVFQSASREARPFPNKSSHAQ